MMLQLPALNKINETYVCFGISNSVRGLSEVIVSKFSEMLEQISHDETEGDNYLTVYFYHEDVLVLGNKAIEQCQILNRPDLAHGIASQIRNIQNNRRSIIRKVKCIETGKIYDSAFSCAKIEGVNYSQLHRHLSRMGGYNKVGKRTYEWI